MKYLVSYAVNGKYLSNEITEWNNGIIIDNIETFQRQKERVLGANVIIIAITKLDEINHYGK